MTQIWPASSVVARSKPSTPTSSDGELDGGYVDLGKSSAMAWTWPTSSFLSATSTRGFLGGAKELATLWSLKARGARWWLPPHQFPSPLDKGLALPDLPSRRLAAIPPILSAREVPTKVVEDELKTFDAEFVNVDQSTLFNLILVRIYRTLLPSFKLFGHRNRPLLFPDVPQRDISIRR
ncbi:hypothetical protein E2562_029622 [Oryza meyeriana var. granulata]|uniref:Uncharacterized protein n=1 Tax=Oryza meyeriana var. granulata TaxID=110450 RepID=A0A6G1E6C9_9ORYZ|nr:hypothetical protein E2562_029622 [Oryza meyeriana var. granulata]